MVVKGTKSAHKMIGGNAGKGPGDEQLGESSKCVAPPFEGSAGQSSYSGLASREGTSDVSSGSKKAARKLGHPKKAIELLPLNTMLHLHPGWQGMKEVTRMDVTIPKGQLMVLETDAAWYRREEHLAHRNTPSTHDNVAIQSPCNRGSPQCESSALLPSLPNYSYSDSELSWSPSPVAQNAMPPDSSAIQPPETPVPRRLKDSCRRCKDYELICSSLQFQTESPCESCHNAGESCEYGHAAEGVSRRKRRKTHQKVTDDATEGEEEGESHPPTWKNTRGEVATSGTDFSYADPELDEFSFSANQTVKGPTLIQRESTSKKPASDMVQGANINNKPKDNSTCSISSTNKPSTERLESSYEDPEFGDFSVTIKKPANKVSTASQKDGGLKKRGFEGKLSFASTCAKPELDVFLSTKKSRAGSANCTRKNANRKKSPLELPSKSVPKRLKDSAVASAGSDTDGETQLMLNPHGTTNVAKFGLLRSQALVYKKEEERKKQERLSLGLPEEEDEGVTNFRISEPEPYDGYSSSEDKEQERQRKARSITANCSSDHSGPNEAKYSSLSPALDLDGINSPSYQSSDVSSHASSGGKYDRRLESSHCEGPFVVAPDTIHPGLASPTHPRDAFRQNDSEVDSLEDPPQAVSASNRDKSSTSNAMSQLAVRGSPRKLTAQEPIVLEDHHEDEDDEDEIPQAIPTAYVAPRTSHIAVVQVHEIESDKRGKFQELEPVSDVASPNGDAGKPSASIALTSRDQIPLLAHEKKDWDTPSRDVSQPERAKFSLRPEDKPAIQEVVFPSTAPQRQGATIQVKDTPYPLTKSVSYQKLTAAGTFKTLGSDENPAVLYLEGDEIIPGTPSSSQPFEVVIPVQQGIKRKNCVENPTAESKKLWKRPRIRKLEFGSQEAGFKDLSDLAKEHKKRYLESVRSSIKSVEEGNALDGHKIERMQVPDGQRVAAEKGPVVAPLPPPLTIPLLSVNTAMPSPTFMQPPILKLKESPVSVAQMSLSSRRSSTSTRRREQSQPKSESSTQKALKAIIAAKRASLSGNSPGPISPSNALFTSVSPASRSSTVSRTPHKVMKPVSSRNSLNSVPSLAFAGSLPDQHNPSRKTHPPTKAAHHALKILNSDDAASDTGDVISARPPPPRTQEVQMTLIPSVAAPPLPEKPERIGNYASIEGRDINVLIPGYNRLPAEEKSRLNDLRKAYFGPGELELQSSELVTAEEESRQRRIQEFRDRFKEEVPKKKLWWQEDDTLVRSYNRKLGAVKSVKQELERRDEGVTRVEVERLSRGGMLKNIMRML
ncbi:hypothetical protein BGX38DRAFT_1276407 [Terfezia claveryi]|nr:hypothetical protein BGX38DRAFT_1276407 [Terfezia claveryi]